MQPRDATHLCGCQFRLAAEQRHVTADAAHSLGDAILEYD
jgi:hypothetical protein